MGINTHWYPMVFNCPKCQDTVVVDRIYFSADSDLRVVCICYKCSHEVSFVSSLPKMVAQAIYMDLEKFWEKQKEPRPIVPPLKPPENKKEDEDFLHGMGISGGDE